MNGGLIPTRYAKALYKLALDQKCDSSVYDRMQTLVGSFESNSDLSKVLANPFVSREDKTKILLAAAGPEPSDIYKGFVRLILDNKREEFAYEMALAYCSIYRKANDISTVRITTAMNLPDQEMQQLVKMIADAFPNRKLEISSRVNPEIIGGFVADVDQVRMDASISSELETLRLKLISTK